MAGVTTRRLEIRETCLGIGIGLRWADLRLDVRQALIGLQLKLRIRALVQMAYSTSFGPQELRLAAGL